MEQGDKSKTDKYNERLQRARNAIKNKTSLASTTSAISGAIGSDEIKVDVSSAAEEEIVPAKDSASEEDVPVFRDGKWYTRDGREVQVKKVLRFTWKW